MSSLHRKPGSGRWLRFLGWSALVVLLAFCVLGVAFYCMPLAFTDAQLRLHLWRQHVRSEYVQVDGNRVHYFEALPPMGSADRKLVLIHGLGARGEDWAGMIPTLAAQGFHVYAPDLLGYGRSAKPDADYSIRMEEKSVADFMQVMGIDHADIGGWSMGGWIALKLTLDHPGNVDRLFVYDAAGIYFPPTFNASLFTPTDAPGLTRLLAILTPRPKAIPGFGQRAAIRKLQASAWVLNRSVASMLGGRDLLDFQLHSIHKPTLLMWGAEDQLIPPAVGEKMHRQIAGSSFVQVEGCGHLAPAECSRPMLRETVRFLKADPPESAYERTIPGHS